MAIWDLFSKREARKRKQGKEDVFQYHNLPEAFRVQVIHIWRDALGQWVEQEPYSLPISYKPNTWWLEIFNAITREKGVCALSKQRENPCAQCYHYLMESATEDSLDLIEFSFRMIDRVVRGMNIYERRDRYRLAEPDDAIEELNGRFREHAIGYEFVDGEIIRVDSQFIHAQAVRPALELLHGAGKGFAGPLQEFLRAHDYYRKGEDKDAITWALKAFESTMKAICTARGWTFDAHKDTASKLVEIVFTQDLVPTYLQNHVSALRTVLESGVPTVRNKTSGHGQGASPVAVPPHYTRYALHMTASCIVFLIECHKAVK
jgi:hypothetical protein